MEKGRETSMCKRNINWLPLAHPQLGTRPTTQACVLTGNQTSDLLVCGMIPNPLSHTSQGWISIIFWWCFLSTSRLPFKITFGWLIVFSNSVWCLRVHHRCSWTLLFSHLLQFFFEMTVFFFHGFFVSFSSVVSWKFLFFLNAWAYSSWSPKLPLSFSWKICSFLWSGSLLKTSL